MKYKIAYSFDNNGFYTGEVKAWEDPKNPGNYLLPKNSTFKKPILSKNKIPKFVDEEWVLVPNYRGKVYYNKKTQEKWEIKDYGIEPDNNWTEKKPSEGVKWSDEKNDWIIDLDYWKTKRKQYIKQKFMESFNNGYTCFNGITMDCKLEDIDKLDKGYRLAQKLNQTEMLIRDFYNQEHILQLSEVDQMLTELGINYQQQWQKKINLQKQINEATTIDEVMNIDWQ